MFCQLREIMSVMQEINVVEDKISSRISTKKNIENSVRKFQYFFIIIS
ncbi:MAG: hypothetical protein PUB18_02985 [bacterium]|nr:hypothetical protein [bacterium]